MDDLTDIINNEITKRIAFTTMVITDTPTDNLATVNRKYVNLNGTSANRPSSSIVGQQYFDTTINRPIFADGNNWRDATSSIVG